MSTIYAKSSEGVHQSLDLFTLPLTQSSVENKKVVRIPAISDNSAIIKFHYQGSDEFIDLSESFFLFQIKLTDRAGTDHGLNDCVAPICNTLDSMISILRIKIGEGRRLDQNNNAYAYGSYLHHLMSPKDVQESSLLTQNWFKDFAGALDSTVVRTGAAGSYVYTYPNKGFEIRHKAIQGGKILELRAKICHGLCQQERYILNHMKIYFELVMNDPKFYLIGTDAALCKIIKKELCLCSVKVREDIQSAILSRLVKSPAMYPFTESEMYVHAYASGLTTITEGSLYVGPTPSRMILAMVETKAFEGNFEKNPFKFLHNRVRKFELKVDGEIVQREAYELDFDNNQFTELYLNLFQGVGALQRSKGLNITPHEFANGYTLFVYDLRPDDIDDCLDLEKQTTLSLELTFAEGLSENITLINYMEFPRVFEIYANKKTRVV